MEEKSLGYSEDFDKKVGDQLFGLGKRKGALSGQPGKSQVDP